MKSLDVKILILLWNEGAENYIQINWELEFCQLFHDNPQDNRNMPCDFCLV